MHKIFTMMFTYSEINLQYFKVASAELNTHSERVVFIAEPFTGGNKVVHIKSPTN